MTTPHAVASRHRTSDFEGARISGIGWPGATDLRSARVAIWLHARRAIRAGTDGKIWRTAA